MIIIASHVYTTASGPVYGPVDVLDDYLKTKRKKRLVIKYPLTSKIPLPIKSIFEILFTFLRLVFQRPEVYIGLDPLNAFPGVMARKLGLIKKTVYYCVDYTPTRFVNKFLNSVYLWMDRFCSLNSDQVWNVSGRIVDLRRRQGIDVKKIKFVPNAPSFKDCPKTPADKIDKNKIVMVAGLTHSPALKMALKSFKKVSKKYPKLHLSIIGTGPYQEKLEKKLQKMGLSEKVDLAGQLPNKKLLKEVSKSALALAIYTFSKDFSWVYYGDSKKAREYLACGTPVVITDVVGTSLDIEKYKAGLVIKPNANELERALEKMVGNSKFRLQCRKNALKLAKDYDINTILDTTLSSFLNPDQN